MKVPALLNLITDKVLAYKPAPVSKAAKRLAKKMKAAKKVKSQNG